MSVRTVVLPVLVIVGVVGVLLAVRSISGEEPVEPAGTPSGVERTEQPRPGPDAPGVDPNAVPMPKGGPGK
jgi:hypothetical protein